MSNMEFVKITFIGHSTTLIEGGGAALLTDPNFSSRVLLVKRAAELKYDPSKLPGLTAVVISHTHFDHLDYPSFNYIKTTVPIIVPEGSERTITRFFPNPVIELSHWTHHEFGGQLKIHAMPATHPNGILCPHFYKNASSYIIQIGDKTVFFAGDTAYNTHFRDIGNMYSIDAALLPIGCYRPAPLLKRYHMDPTEAVQAFLDLKAKVMIPIHWGTFRLTLEKLSEPIERLRAAIAERGIEDRVKVLTSGQSFEIT